jgi:hypothetical protein
MVGRGFEDLKHESPLFCEPQPTLAAELVQPVHHLTA